jgi:hypothetical protein
MTAGALLAAPDQHLRQRVGDRNLKAGDDPHEPPALGGLPVAQVALQVGDEREHLLRFGSLHRLTSKNTTCTGQLRHRSISAAEHS